MIKPNSMVPRNLSTRPPQNPPLADSTAAGVCLPQTLDILDQGRQTDSQLLGRRDYGIVIGAGTQVGQVAVGSNIVQSSIGAGAQPTQVAIGDNILQSASCIEGQNWYLAH